MIISLIVAMDEKGGIGKDGRLPWRLPSDLKRFKQITMGHYLVMGRKTYETIGKPLPGRRMIIVTRQKDYFIEGCIIVGSLKEAINLADSDHEEELFIIGGGEIFHQAIQLANKIYLTTVFTDVDADVFFPRIDPAHWLYGSSAETSPVDNDEYGSDFKVLIRKH